mgnify:FL=1
MDKSLNKLFTQGLRPLQSLLPENAKKILKKDGFVYFEIIKNWKNIVLMIEVEILSKTEQLSTLL